MDTFLWNLFNRTSETQFIFNLLHLLLAGLTLLVLLHQMRGKGEKKPGRAEQMLWGGFLLFVLHFGLRTLYFAVQFFLQKNLEWAHFELGSHGLIACGTLLIVAGLLLPSFRDSRRLLRWTVRGVALVVLFMLADVVLPWVFGTGTEATHSALMGGADLAMLAIAGGGFFVLLRRGTLGSKSGPAAVALLGLASLLHLVAFITEARAGALTWNAEQHVITAALFAFAWFVGERGQNLLDRVFVRLNLTFIVLATLVMFVTSGMEKIQYFRLAQDRSMNLAEFLRGHVIFYHERGDSLEDIFAHSEVMRRVVVEFGTLPELREIHVHLDERQATFRYTSDWEIIQQIGSAEDHRESQGPYGDSTDRFQILRLPFDELPGTANRLELFGTMDYVDRNVGVYIILIYLLFTGMVGVSILVIGFVVRDADRRLQQQYAEIQTSQRQLAQAAKLASIGELAGGVAHEINNPITAILSTASHLETRKTSEFSEREKKSLGMISREAQRVSRIVHNLLTFSRQSRLELLPVDVNDQLRMAVALVDHRLRGSPVEFRQELGDDLPMILGDANRLTEVFVNLLTNALDAMPEGGTLAVRTLANPQEKGGVRIEVADTGSGIAAEDLPRIFDPFFTTKEPGKGTGLGLSISHGIVKDHKGEIWVHSTPGQGTTFYVTLPQKEKQDEG